MTIWSPQQQSAIAAVQRWLNSDEQVFRIFGYAGTGKTTIAKHLAELADGEVLFGAFTGKAALVLRRKGCTNASTIHKLIYTSAGEAGGPQDTTERENELRALEEKLAALGPAPVREPGEKLFAYQLRCGDRPALEHRISMLRREIQMENKKRAKPMFHLNEESKVKEAALVIIDECSMVDEPMARDLMSFGTKILVLGDSAQLPPVGGGGYFTNCQPDVLLTDVHRQARESGILRLATDVREGNEICLGMYGDDCEVRRPGADLSQLVMDADQVLVGMNKTRHKSNQRYRELLGKGSSDTVAGVLPQPGDKLVCLRNDHKIGLLNGSLWRVHESLHYAEQMVGELTISSEEDPDINGLKVSTHLHHFLGREDELRKIGWDRKDHQEFDYGYALTVHKAQGSQWDEVVLFDESGAFRQDSRRWLYTGITRAAKKLVVVR